MKTTYEYYKKIILGKQVAKEIKSSEGLTMIISKDKMYNCIDIEGNVMFEKWPKKIAFFNENRFIDNIGYMKVLFEDGWNFYHVKKKRYHFEDNLKYVWVGSWIPFLNTNIILLVTVNKAGAFMYNYHKYDGKNISSIWLFEIVFHKNFIRFLLPTGMHMYKKVVDNVIIPCDEKEIPKSTIQFKSEIQNQENKILYTSLLNKHKRNKDEWSMILPVRNKSLDEGVS